MDTQYIVTMGNQIIKSLLNIKKRMNVQAKTSFLRIFDDDDYQLYDGVAGALSFAIGFPRGLYDAKTNDKEMIAKNACLQYYQALYNLPLNIRDNLRSIKIQEYLQKEPVEESQIGIKHIVSNEKDKRKVALIEQVIEEIEWNNSVLQNR